jgi:rubrerythrin
VSVLRFNADDVFDIALRIERNGAAFYRRAATIVQDARSRDLMLELAAREEGHERVFSALRSRLSGPEVEPTVFDPDGESALYLWSLADSEVFGLGRESPLTMLQGDETRAHILREAIEREKDSIVFYVGMRELVPERLGRGTIDSILTEEMRHIRILSTELKSE